MNSSQATRQPRVPSRARSRSQQIARVAGVSMLLLLLFAVAAAAGGWLWLHHAMRDALPQLDGEAHLGGLATSVIVQRDAQGVPLITAGSVDDMLEAQGYVTAQDRLWQMDMARRLASGEAAEILGAKLVEHDTLQRVFSFRSNS